MIRPNPYSLSKPWSDSTLKAFQSMPTNKAGMVVGLPHTPDALVPAAEQQWREWCAKTPKHLWPVWADSWADTKRLRGLS
jgi:hypothetical protein